MADDSSSLFAVFFLALYTLVLIPYTIYKICNAASGSTEAVKPWLKAKRSGRLKKFARQFLQPSNFILLGLWIIFVLLVLYAQATAKDAQPFDPYSILQLETSATDKEIKRAYRQMSLKYHPDKNPDPAAGKFFAEFIVKAYKALSDPIARKNFAEHGHPDGPQSITMGLALPEWLLDSKSKSAPLILAGLVFGGILLPLIAAACYLMSANKFVGPNGIMEETFDYFLRSQVGVREAQSLGRIPETLTVAMEFITMPTLQDQLPAMEELRKQTLRLHPELRDKKNFWGRKASCLKAHMLLLAHLSRDDIPATLAKDLVYVLRKSPQLLEEIIKIAIIPRPPYGAGWLAPTMGAIEFLQHLTQAVPLASRRNPGALKGGVEGSVPLLQLPHMDVEVLRKLTRKKLRSLPELQQADPLERHEALLQAGLTPGQVAQVETSLASIPTLVATASCLVDGELKSDIYEGDVVTCRAHVLLSRPSHATAGFSGEGKGVQAFAPHYPVAREEMWYFVVADPSNNAVLGMTRVTLLEAEYLAAQAEDADRAAAAAAVDGKTPTDSAQVVGGGDLKAAARAAAAAKGQVVDVKFNVHAAGRREFTLYIMSDCWVSVDAVLPIHLKVQELSRAEKEGRGNRKVIALDEAGNPEDADMLYMDEDNDEDDAAAEEEDEEDEDWDSEESGSDESGSDEEEVTPVVSSRRRAGGAVVIEEVEENSSCDEDAADGVVPVAATLSAAKKA